MKLSGISFGVVLQPSRVLLSPTRGILCPPEMNASKPSSRPREIWPRRPGDIRTKSKASPLSTTRPALALCLLCPGSQSSDERRRVLAGLAGNGLAVRASLSASYPRIMPERPKAAGRCLITIVSYLSLGAGKRELTGYMQWSGVCVVLDCWSSSEAASVQPVPRRHLSAAFQSRIRRTWQAVALNPKARSRIQPAR